MHKRKIKLLAMFIIMIIANLLLIIIVKQSYYQSIGIQFNVKSDKPNQVQIFYASKQDGFNENDSTKFDIQKKDTQSLLGINIAYPDVNYFRIDFDETKKTTNILSDFDIYKNQNHQNAMDTLKGNIITNDCDIILKNKTLFVNTTGKDPYIVIKLDKKFMADVMNGNTKSLVIMTVIGCVFLTICMLGGLHFIRRNRFAKDIYDNRKLIRNLSVNDFKTKYAGSFFGILWAFVQPIVTIVLYWFVFQVGFRSGDVGNFPFVLWLITGLVPWFFFQDAITAGTNCLIEYSYLVKKMVFQIKILPFVKIISALFVHLFFICFTFIIFAANGYFPTLYSLQILYYLFCAIVLTAGITFATSAVMVFFKDLGQIVQIVLQIGMWMTPIMWNIQMIPANFLWLIQLNPMYYIVEGFRDSFINHVWVWNKLDLTINFWLITVFLFIFGITIFKKLNVHFADVL